MKKATDVGSCLGEDKHIFEEMAEESYQTCMEHSSIPPSSIAPKDMYIAAYLNGTIDVLDTFRRRGVKPPKVRP